MTSPASSSRACTLDTYILTLPVSRVPLRRLPPAPDGTIELSPTIYWLAFDSPSFSWTGTAPVYLNIAEPFKGIQTHGTSEKWARRRMTARRVHNSRNKTMIEASTSASPWPPFLRRLPRDSHDSFSAAPRPPRLARLAICASLARLPSVAEQRILDAARSAARARVLFTAALQSVVAMFPRIARPITCRPGEVLTSSSGPVTASAGPEGCMQCESSCT